MEIRIIKEIISLGELEKIAENQFGNLVKAVVDIKKRIIAIGGELHADEEALLVEQGSNQQDLWGINLYPEKFNSDFVEFDSMINIRPSQGNSSRGVENRDICEKIYNVVKKLVTE